MKVDAHKTARSLAKVNGMTTALVASSLHQLIVDGIVDGGEGHHLYASAADDNLGDQRFVVLTPAMVASASTENLHKVRQLRARAARMGYTIAENEKVDVQALDAAIRHCGVSDRIALKAELFKLNLIPA
jgi:hypothetical protein